VHLPRIESFRLNVPVFAFVAVVAMLATILVGTVSALEASRPQPQGTLRDARKATGWVCARPAATKRPCGLRSGLALLLLCGAGLMLRSFLYLNRVSPGFLTEHLLTMKIALPGGTYPRPEQTRAYLDRVMERLQTLPGVASVAAASTLPLSGESDWGTFLIADGARADWAKASAADWRGVSANYFETRHIPLRRGREFTPADEKNQSTMIINEVMARKFWPEADPIGKTLLNRDYRSPLEIIGIVGDVRGAGLNAQAKPEMYTPLRGFWYAFLVLRTKRGPSEMASAVRKEIAALDSGVPTYQVATMDQLLSASVANERFNLFLLVLVAALALGLAAVGIYGVLAFGVSRRSREIGIRLALGARPRDVLRLVVRQGMQLVIAGVLLGIAGALALTRLMASLLYGVSPTDPATFVVVSALLPMVALIACYFPARRAMHVDPMVALRVE